MLGPKVGCGSDRELETSEKNVCFRHVDAKSCQAASGQCRMLRLTKREACNRSRVENQHLRRVGFDYASVRVGPQFR